MDSLERNNDWILSTGRKKGRKEGKKEGRKEGLIKSRHRVLVVGSLLVRKMSWSVVRKQQDSCKGLTMSGSLYMVCGIKGQQAEPASQLLGTSPRLIGGQRPAQDHLQVSEFFLSFVPCLFVYYPKSYPIQYQLEISIFKSYIYKRNKTKVYSNIHYRQYYSPP